MSIIIDPEFKALIPPLSEDEFRQLEENIVAEGIRDPLVVWEVPNGDMILLDGHNRFEIAAKHGGIHFEVKKMHFSGNDREQAKAWMLKNQLGRRNLTSWQKFDLVKKLEEVEKDKAKERMSSGGKGKEIFPDLQGQSRDFMGNMIGVSGKTYDKMKYIDQHGTPEQNKQVRSGERTTNQTWLEIKEKERQQEDLSKKARVEQAKERHEAMKSSPVVSIDDIEQDRKDSAEIARSKYRELENAIKKILFIGASEESFTIINKKTIDGESIRCLMNDINKTIGILNQLWSELAKGR